MAQRLFELKSKREQERQNEVNKRLEQRFKDSNIIINYNFISFILATDELRKEDSKF